MPTCVVQHTYLLILHELPQHGGRGRGSMLSLFLYTIMEMNNLIFDGAVGTTP